MAAETIVAVWHQRIKHTKWAKVRVEALKPTDLEIRAGEFLVILGPSGSGKSTLLNIMGGMDTVTAAEVVLQRRKPESR